MTFNVERLSAYLAEEAERARPKPTWCVECGRLLYEDVDDSQRLAGCTHDGAETPHCGACAFDSLADSWLARIDGKDLKTIWTGIRRGWVNSKEKAVTLLEHLDRYIREGDPHAGDGMEASGCWEQNKVKAARVMNALIRYIEYGERPRKGENLSPPNGLNSGGRRGRKGH